MPSRHLYNVNSLINKETNHTHSAPRQPANTGHITFSHAVSLGFIMEPRAAVSYLPFRLLIFSSYLSVMAAYEDSLVTNVCSELHSA